MGYFFGFGGRFSRMDWWLAHLVVVAGLALTLVWFGVSLNASNLRGKALVDLAHRNGWQIAAPFVGFVWIGFAATVKRYHDRDKSGWWLLISLVPYVGSLWQLIECGFFAGTPGSNSYGDGPDSAPSKSSEWRQEALTEEFDYGSDGASTRLARIAAKTPAWMAKPELVVTPPPSPAAASRVAPIRFGRRSAA